MYLSAIPTIAVQWQVAESLVSQSLVLWFVAFSVFLLVWGPISDRLGRRPVLLVGLGVFLASSFMLAGVRGPTTLIGYRIVQGIGAAAPSTMALAISRDRFEGSQRRAIFGMIGVILGLAPMLSPLCGAGLMMLGSWRLIFVVQGALGVLSFLLSLRFQETAQCNPQAGVAAVLHACGRLLGNQRFLATNTALGLSLGPFFGYIAFSPILYQKIFGLSKVAFSILFGLNALACMLGSLLSVRLAARVTETAVLTASFVGCVLGASGILLLGALHPGAFATTMALFTFCVGISRPVSNHVILEQVRQDIGLASSFLVFYQFLVGAGCMWLACRPWSAPVTAFGTLTLAISIAVLIVWPFLRSILQAAEETTS